MKRKNSITQKVNDYFLKGLKLKDDAIANYQDNIQILDEAANNLKKAKDTLVKSKPVDSFSKCLIDYYESEYHDCQSVKYYMILRSSGDENDMNKAILHNEKRKKSLRKAYEKILKIGHLSPEQEGMMKEWKVVIETTDLMVCNIKARYYFANKLFVEAKDFYEEYLMKIESKGKDIDEILDPRKKRIYHGNMIAVKFNAVQALVAIYHELNEEDKMVDKSIECYELANRAFETNPEQKQYLEGQKTIETNLQNYLRENRSQWSEILEKHDSEVIRKLMIEVDSRRYHQINSPSQLEEKKYHKSNGISQDSDEQLEKNGNDGKKKVPWFKENWKLTLIIIFLSIVMIFITIMVPWRQQRILISYLEKILNPSEKGYNSTYKDTATSDLQSTYLNDLAIKAGYGDRNAFDELRSIASSNGSDESIFAKKVITEIIEKHSSKIYLQVTINDQVPDYLVVEALNDTNPDTRKMAIYTVKKRKLYSEIPILISMVESEEDLDVLAAIYRTLNKLLPVEVSMFQEDAVSIFLSAWNEKKSQIIKIR